LPDFFISYAREDGPFVDRLIATLTAREREVWVDRSPELGEGIEPGDNWRTSTEEGIARSEAFVFVLSDSSARSEPCGGELAHAVAVNKRLLPICIEEPSEEDLVPVQIQDLSWVMMRPGDSFDAGVDALIRALDTDIEVVREHTRLLIRARAWELGNRRSSPLLRGVELRAAEDWLSRAATAGAPPTESQREFIVASRRAATRRQRIAVGGALAVAGVAIGLSIFALVQRAHAVHESNVAFARQLDADSQAQYTTDPELSVLLADRSAQIVPDQGLSNLQTALADSKIRDRYDLVARNAGGDVMWNPTGTRLLVTSPALDGKGWARIYEPGTDAKPISLPGPSSHNASGWDGLGNRFVIGGSRPAVYDASTGRLIARIPGPAMHATLSLNGSEVVYNDTDSAGHVYDVATRHTLVSFHPHYHGGVTCFAVSPNGRYAAQCDARTTENLSSPAELDIWSTATGRLVRSIHAPAVIGSVAFSPTSSRFVLSYPVPTPPHRSLAQTLAAEGAPGTLVYDTTGHGPPVKEFPGGGSAAAFGPNPKDEIVTWATTSDSLGHIYQFSTHRELELTGATDLIGQIAVDTSGAYVLTASDDGDIRIYNAGVGGQPIETLAGDTAPITAASFGGYGEWVASSSDDGTARLWQGPKPVPTSSRPDSPTGDGYVQGIGYTAGGARIIMTGGSAASGKGQIIDPRTLATVATFHAAPGQLFGGSATAPNGSIFAALTYIVSGDTVKAAALDTFNARTGARLATIAPHSGPTPVSALLSPSGSTIALLGGSGAVELCNARSGSILHVLAGGGGAVQTLAFSRDGTRLAIGRDPARAGGDVTVQVYDVATGRLQRTLLGPKQVPESVVSPAYAPLAVALSPDGRELALAGATTTVGLYDVTNGRLIHQWPLEGTSIGAFAGALAFSPDGTLLAAGTGAGAFVWQLPSGDELDEFQQSGIGAGPTLTAGTVVHVGFSTNSRYLIARQSNGIVGGSLDEWDVEDGLAMFASSSLSNGAATADGSRLVTASLAGLKTYRCRLCANLEQLKSLAATSVTRGFTRVERAHYLKR
jgi:WD40 repeat protein